MAEFDAHADCYRESVQRSIDFCGQELDYFTRRKADHRVDLASRRIGRCSRLSVLDVGCGVGVTDEFLVGRVGELHGVDVSESAVACAAERNPAARYQSYDGRTLPYGDASLDLAFAICVMHHVPPPEWPGFVAEMARVVRPGGLVAVFEHNPFNPLTRAAVGRCEFDVGVTLLRRKRVEALMSGAGLRPSESRYIIFTTSERPELIALERTLRGVPFGAQHYVVGRRPAPTT
jgi:SAM-dependent methyltransferase